MYSQYSTPPPGYMAYDYIRTPPMSPPPAGYYSPRYQTATPSPRPSPKTHSRRASQADPHFSSYSSSRVPPYFNQGGYSSPRFYPPHASPASPLQRNADYVSNFDRYESSGRRHRTPDRMPSKHRSSYYADTAYNKKHRTSKSRYYYHVVVNDDDAYLYDDAPPPYEQYQSYRDADHYYFYDQVPIYTEAENSSTPRPQRTRRASHSGRPNPPPSKPRPTSTAKSTPKATAEDAARAGIPAGYSYKNWDPTEEPILLLGSVFDANSLGKWIYDWTVFHYGPATPMSEIAGDMWLLLIQLAGKVKRAEEIMPKIRKQENRELIEDFLESGERLWIRFGKLLKLCEDYMMKAAKKECGEKKITMGKNSGCEFVDSIFGRDRELEKTEKLMTGMRLWSMRFDANCDDILRYPSA